MLKENAVYLKRDSPAFENGPIGSGFQSSLIFYGLSRKCLVGEYDWSRQVNWLKFSLFLSFKVNVYLK